MFECEPNCKYCAYNNWRKEAYFWSKVKKTHNCWLWLGGIDFGGYGRIGYMGKQVYAHRFSKSLTEPLIDGLEIDHLCRNRNCVNPDHLEQVNHKTNLRRSPIHIMTNQKLNPHAGQKKIYCKYGHIIGVTDSGVRVCRVCRQRLQKEYKQRIKDRKVQVEQ